MKISFRIFYLTALLQAAILAVSALEPAKDAPRLFLKSQIENEKVGLDESLSKTITNSEIFNDRFYKIAQFDKVLTEIERQDLENAGLRFLSYIPQNAYLISFPVGYHLSDLKSKNIIALIDLNPSLRLSRVLFEKNYPDYARNSSGQIDLMLEFFGDIPFPILEQELSRNKIELISHYENQSQVHIRLPIEKIELLSQLPFVKYIQPVSDTPVPDDTKGRSLHRSNTINSEFATGLHYNGEGVGISLADDGEVGPHIDFQGRLTNILTIGAGGNHGDMTSGIAVGAGNLDPTKRGMADGANIFIHDINEGPDGYDHIYNSPFFYQNYGAVITSTSYSQGCNDYDLFSQAGDQLVRQNPQISMVFSAGNHAGSDCGYGAGAPWGTITGGFKQGKNVITVGNLDAFGVLDNSSSQGPSADGRIKPDICANGKNQLSTDQDNTYQVGGGTSAACPSIAGVCAQLYHAFKDLNNNNEPEAALIKASLINTAEEIGNPGPDFTYGWGRVNALRAFHLIQNNNFRLDSMAQGGSRNITLSIPSGVRQAKIMLYWQDFEGDPLASISLVNDLDLTVQDPNSTTLYPWILDPSPNIASITANATTGVDHLNNVEQVSIDHPAAGNYTIHVNGFAIPQGNQHYYILWEFITDQITLTYPNGGEGFVPGESELIRWDAFDTSNTFTLEYSTDNGSSWIAISSNISGSSRQYAWNVPVDFSDEAQLRLTQSSQTDMSDHNFSILGIPGQLQIDYACSDTLQFSWSTADGASLYEVSQLGYKYMDSVSTTSATHLKIPISQSLDTWFSVRSIGNHGGKGRRAIAIHKAPGTYNCSFPADMHALSIPSPTDGNRYSCDNNSAVPITFRLRNDGINDASNIDLSYRVNNGSWVNEIFAGVLAHGDYLDFTFSSPVNFQTPGSYVIDAFVDFPGDLNPFNDSVQINVGVVDDGSIPFIEEFQGAIFPPDGWTVMSTDSGYSWDEIFAITGSDGNLTTAAWFDDFSYRNPGAEDNLTTQLIDLHGLTAPMLTFDVAYSVYTGYQDGLRIDASDDCGISYLQTSYLKIGDSLATVPSSNTDWQPTMASDWRKDTLDLSAYANQSVFIRFVNINDYGNNLYIDNINVSQNLSVKVEEQENNSMINIFPNPTDGKISINTNSLKSEKSELHLFDCRGRNLMTREINLGSNSNQVIDLEKFDRGIYFLRLVSNNKQYTFRITLI